MKPVPKFWWDFHGIELEIHVESDLDYHSFIVCDSIEEAEQLISDLVAGRKDWRKLSRE